ncbi:MAG: NFACT family protein [Nitrospirota bacterium]|nr:NFACT family protein [Nitrospirota bacterium]
MAISIKHLSQVLIELKPAISGGIIQKIFQPFLDSLSLEIRRPGQTTTLFISTHPQTARLHALTQQLPNPNTPPSFCQYLRKHLLGAKIVNIRQVPNDRVMVCNILVKQEQYGLVVALTGRSANIIILDQHHNVLRTLKPENQASQRIKQYLNFLENQSNTETRVQPQIESPPQAFPISIMLEQTHLELQQQEAKRRQQEQELATLRKAIKKVQRRIQSLAQDLEKAQRYCEYGRYGELLKGHLEKIHRGQAQITIVDYYDEHLPKLTLPLDPTKDAAWNLKDYFRKHRKFTGAEREVRPRLKQAQTNLEKLTQEFQDAERGEMKPSDSPKPNLKLTRTSKPATKVKRALPYRRYVSEEGFAILVGKNAKGNDTLTFKVSKQDDVWLHARGIAGSHVIIELEKKKQIPSETLKDAANLALFYSDLRKSGKGEVIYTLRKNVRKPKGAKPGSVTVTQEKTVWVYVDQVRLDRLKNSVDS